MIHQNEPPGNKGVTLNGRAVTADEAAEIRKALGIALQRQLTLKAGDVLTVPWSNAAKVHTLGTEFDVEFAFEIPEGRPGIDGIGSVDAAEAVSVPFGQAPDVINFGTPERAKLRFYIPEGPRGAPGIGVPLNPVEDFVVGFKNGTIQWVPQAAGTGNPGSGGGTTIINTGGFSLAAPYPWETAVVIPPVDPGAPQTVFDAVTYTTYQAAAGAAAVGSKRQAAADSLITTFGTAQKLSMKRNGVTVFTADYSGLMTKTTVGVDVGVVLQNMTGISAITAADIASGTWTMVISGGTGFARTMTLNALMEASTDATQGFNPGPITFILPRSLDGI